MRVVPRNIGPKISFFQTHLAKWQENAGKMGVSEEAVAAVAALVEEAKAAHLAQRAAKQAAQSKTTALYDVIEWLDRAGSTVIQQVRATARTEGEGVYVLAQISPPADPAPVAPPGKPERFKAELLGGGSLRLTWTCKNPPNATGTLYQLSRLVYVAGEDRPRRRPGGQGGQAGFEPIGLVGKKRFVDETLPRGTQMVTYKIRAVRSTAAGPANTFNVDFYNTMPRSAGMRPRGGDAVAA